MKTSKPALIKVLGGSAVAAPTVGAGTYAIITQKEFEGLHSKIRILETRNNEQEITLNKKEETITILKKEPTAEDKLKDKTQIEDLGKQVKEKETTIQKQNEEIIKLKKDIEDKDSQNTTQFSQIQDLNKKLAAKNKEKIVGSDEHKAALRKEINRELIKQIVDENSDGVVDDLDKGRTLGSPVFILNRCDDTNWKFEWCWKRRILTVDNGELKIAQDKTGAPTSGFLWDQVKE